MEALQWILSAGANFFEAIQLNNEMERLRASLPKARMLMYRSQWDMSKNTELARLLSLLKETIYDAEDILRDLDDKAQRQSVQGDDLSMAGQLLASSLNNLGKVFVHRSKTKLKEAQDKLDKVVTEIEGVLNLMGLMSFQPSQIMPQTSSVVGAAEVVGRDDERDVLMEMLGVTLGREAQRDQVIELLGVPLPLTRGQHRRSAGPNNGKRPTTSNDVASTSRAKQPKRKLAETDCNSNVSVIPIVGIGGMGKTTLAQFIYNDPRVVHHFGVMIWVCVSDFFDKIRITREIIESMPGEKFDTSSGSINAFQVELMKRLKVCPRFLLVLDDIWPNANDDWEAFYAPLRHGPQGSMILVTTRCPVVATRVATINFEPVQLERLPTDIFWKFK